MLVLVVLEIVLRAILSLNKNWMTTVYLFKGTPHLEDKHMSLLNR